MSDFKRNLRKKESELLNSIYFLGTLGCLFSLLIFV